MPSYRISLLIVALAIGARLLAASYLQTRVPPGARFEFGDSESYWDLGHALALGQPFEFDGKQVFRTPGYPLALAAMMRVVGDTAAPFWGRALSALLGGAMTAIVIAWAARLFPPGAALLAGALVAIYPGLVALGACVLSEALFMPLMVAQLALWTIAWQARERRLASGERTWACEIGWSCAAGAMAGAATLVRPSWLLFVPFAVLAGVVIQRQAWRWILASGLAALVGLVAVMAPWWLRNYQITGHFVPTTLQVGASLYDGLNPTADGSSNMAFAVTFEQMLRFEDLQSVAAPTDSFEYRLDARLRQASLRWVADHQGRAVQLAFIKLARIWNIWPNEPAFRAWPARILVVVSYVPLLVGGLFGAWRFTGRGWPYVLCWLPAVYFSLLHMIFIGSLRYREPAMMGLIVLAAGVWAEIAVCGVVGGSQPGLLQKKRELVDRF